MEFHAKHPSNPALSQLKYVNIKHSQRKKKKNTAHQMVLHLCHLTENTGGSVFEKAVSCYGALTLQYKRQK